LQWHFYVLKLAYGSAVAEPHTKA